MLRWIQVLEAAQLYEYKIESIQMNEESKSKKTKKYGYKKGIIGFNTAF